MTDIFHSCLCLLTGNGKLATGDYFFIWPSIQSFTQETV